MKRLYTIIVDGSEQTRWLTQADLAWLIQNHVVTSIRKVS